MESVSHCQKQTFPSAPVETIYRKEPFTIGLNYKGKKKVVRKTQTQILKNYLWTCKNACVKNHSTRCKAKLLKCLLIMLQKQHLLYSKINRCCRFQWLHYITTHSLLCFGTHYKFYHCMKELADRALEKKVKRIFTR